MMSNNDAINIGAQHRIVPDARVIAQSDIAYDDRAWGDENALPKLRLAGQELLELLCDVSHKSEILIFLDPPENRNVKARLNLGSRIRTYSRISDL